MGINKDRMSGRLDDDNKGGNGLFWKPQKPAAGSENKYTLRILPDPNDDPFWSFDLHYGFGEAHMCVRKHFNEQCAICNFGFDAMREAKEKGDEEAHIAARKKFMPSRRFYACVIARNPSPDVLYEGPKVWGFSRKVYEKFWAIINNCDYGDDGDITHPELGNDITLTYSLAPKELYPASDILPRAMRTPLFEDKKEMATVLENLPDVKSLFMRLTETEVQSVLHNFLRPKNTENVKYAADDDDPIQAKYDSLVDDN